MKRKKYTKPVEPLLYLGKPKITSYLPDKWPNYVEKYGLTESDIPQLLDMATDSELYFADLKNKKIWAPIHAIRALSQLHSEEVIDTLLDLWIEYEEDKWISEMILGAFIELGELALPSLKTFFDENRDESVASSVPEAIGKMGVKYPKSRNKCINWLKEELQKYRRHDSELNGFLVWALMDLNAMSTLPLIKEVFMNDSIDKTIVGDWLDVRYQMTQETPDKFSAKKSTLEKLITKKPK